VVDVFVENDTSALMAQRPVYHRLLNGIEDRKVDAVVVWSPERLQRSVRELEDFIELIERNHVSVETVKAVQRGLWRGSAPYGMKLSDTPGILVGDPTKALLV
jgi:DNA invertase Pin-like site-specific DNA recombinase